MKRIIIVLGIIIAVGAAYGWYQFNRTAADTATKSPDFSLTAMELASEFTSDESSANEKYLGKVIEVEGELLSKESSDILILTLKGADMINLRAEMATNQAPDLATGAKVKVKGICTGFLLDVVLNECVTVD